MFREHGNVVWGDRCKCGKESYLLQNKFHPWVDTDFVAVLQCSSCGNTLEIDRQKAEAYYISKILSYYNDVKGAVIDMGCGEGFLTEAMAAKEAVTRVYAIDCDENYRASVEQIPNAAGKISFEAMDIANLGEAFAERHVDYLISRDVFMFIENTEKFFDDAARLVKKGIKQMGWFVGSSERMKNKLQPDQIAEELRKRGWKVRIEYLDWYKCGYFIDAVK